MRLPEPLQESLSNLFFPYNVTCPLCTRSLVGAEQTVCCNCEKKLEQCLLTPAEQLSAHEPLKLCISAFSYEDPAKELIHILKYRSDTTVAPLLGLYLAKTLLDVLHRPCWDVIIPVPMQPGRQADRGYNQAELLAKAVAHHWQSPIRNDLLFRIREDGSQTKRTAAERREAITRVFVASPLAYGKHILLVDDVLTTGATASACAKALLEAGAAEVILLTLCQA